MKIYLLINLFTYLFMKFSYAANNLDVLLINVF